MGLWSSIHIRSQIRERGEIHVRYEKCGVCCALEYVTERGAFTTPRPNAVLAGRAGRIIHYVIRGKQGTATCRTKLESIHAS